MTSNETTTALLFPGQGSHAVGMEEPHRDHPLLGAASSCWASTRSTRLADGHALASAGALSLLDVPVGVRDETARRRSPPPATRSASTPR